VAGGSHSTEIVLHRLRNSDVLPLQQFVLEDLNGVEDVHGCRFGAASDVGVVCAIALAISPERVLVEVVQTERLCDRVELACLRNRVRNNVGGVYLSLALPNIMDFTRMK